MSAPIDNPASGQAVAVDQPSRPQPRQSTFSRWANRHRKWLFAAPAMVFTAAMLIFPLVWTIYLSLTNAQGSVRAPKSFIGFDNYIDVLTDTERFYSYRREPRTGRLASLIWLESAQP